MKRIAAASLLIAGLWASSPGLAEACPLCKYANESEQADEKANLRPRAYMYSILFMLSMPATIFTAFGVGFYRMSRKAQAESSDLPISD